MDRLARRIALEHVEWLRHGNVAACDFLVSLGYGTRPRRTGRTWTEITRIVEREWLDARAWLRHNEEPLGACSSAELSPPNPAFQGGRSGVVRLRR